MFLPLDNSLKGLINIVLYCNLNNLYTNDRTAAVNMLRHLALYVLQSINININVQPYDNTNMLNNEFLPDSILGEPQQLSSLLRLVN